MFSLDHSLTPQLLFLLYVFVNEASSKCYPRIPVYAPVSAMYVRLSLPVIPLCLRVYIPSINRDRHAFLLLLVFPYQAQGAGREERGEGWRGKRRGNQALHDSMLPNACGLACIHVMQSLLSVLPLRCRSCSHYPGFQP